MKLITKIYIDNFKAFKNTEIILDRANNGTVFIGENDSGKSSILQALDYFFNSESLYKGKIDEDLIPDPSKDVVIGVRIGNQFHKRIFTGKTHKLSAPNDEGKDSLELERMQYIYLPVALSDPVDLLGRLASAKFDEIVDDRLVEEVEQVSQRAIDLVLEGVDPELVVVGQDKTSLKGSAAISIGKSVAYKIESDGIPAAGRGTGFSKNLSYAMLVGTQFDNLILGIDEVENSFSMRNCSDLLGQIKDRMKQVFVTTHSGAVLGATAEYSVYPLGGDSVASVAKVLESLGEGKKPFLLIEGRYDLPWYKAALSLLGVSNEYYVIPAGGSNLALLQQEMTDMGLHCLSISDGDTKGARDESRCEYAISRDCIELYAPESLQQELFRKTIDCSSKTGFFDEAVETLYPNCDKRNRAQMSNAKDDVKELIASKITNHLGSNSEYVKEVEGILNRFAESECTISSNCKH